MSITSIKWALNEGFGISGKKIHRITKMWEIDTDLLVILKSITPKTTTTAATTSTSTITT